MTPFLLFLSLISAMIGPSVGLNPVFQSVDCPLEESYTPPAEDTSQTDLAAGIFILPVTDGRGIEINVGAPIAGVYPSPDATVYVLAVEESTPYIYQTLYKVDTETAELRPLLSEDALRALRTEAFSGGVILGSPTFIPNTHTLMFYTEIIPNVEGIYFEVPLDVWALDVDNGELTEIFPYGEGGKFSISPSGENIILYNIDKIRVSNPDGSNVRTIYNGRVGLGGGEYIAWAETAWVAPNIFRTALLDAPLDAADGGYGMDYPIRIVEFDVSADEPSPIDIMSITGTIFFSVKMSPAGNGLAYWKPTNDGNVRDLIIHAVGSDPITFATGDNIEIAGWLDSYHLAWYETTYVQNTAQQAYFVTDICGTTTPLP